MRLVACLSVLTLWGLLCGHQGWSPWIMGLAAGVVTPMFFAPWLCKAPEDVSL
jgi:hypothetical protein